MGGFLAPVQDALQNFSNRQNQLTGIGTQEQGENQRLAATHWENQRQALATSIKDSAGMEPPGSALRHQYLDMWTRLLGEKPGAKLDNYHTEFSQLQNHARAADQEAQAVAQASQPRQGSPAPAAPGQTPGTPPIVIPPMPDVGYNVPSMPTAQASGSAMLGTSPIQPSQQGGGSSPNAASTFLSMASNNVNTSVPTAAGPSTGTQPNAAGLGNPRNQGNTGTIPPVTTPDEIKRIWESPMSPEERKALAPLVYGPQAIQMMQGLPGFSNYPPFMQTESELEALGLKPPTGYAGMIRPVNVPGLIPTPQGATSALTGEPITTPFVHVQRSLLGGPDLYYPEEGTTVRDIMPDANSATGFSRVVYDKMGNEISRVKGATPPGQFTPKITKSEKETVVDFGDHKEIWPVGTESVTQAVLPGQTGQQQGGTQLVTPPPMSSPTVPPSRNIGAKTLSPNQELTEEQKLGQFQDTVRRAQVVMRGLPMLNSLLESGKLQLETDTDGTLKALVNRAMPLSQQEAQFVSDFIALKEDVNLIRGALGATGFRGPEAFAALQAQKGQLMANPKITQGVIQNLVQALNRQIGPIQKRLGKVTPPTAQTPPGEQPPPAPAMSKTAEEYLRSKGKIK